MKVRPNTRMQRTRSSASPPHSPLMRSPLGDVWEEMRARIRAFPTGAFQLGVGEGVVMKPEELGVCSCPALGQFEKASVEASCVQQLWLKASPNTRMQRTRSSASPPRSPLMRSPLGGSGRCSVALLVALIVARGSQAQPGPSPTPGVTAPILISSEVPDPKEVAERCRGAKHQGFPVLEAYIQADGTVRDAKVTKSCGCPAGDQLLMSSISKWRYKPATANDKPGAVWLTVSVYHFSW